MVKSKGRGSGQWPPFRSGSIILSLNRCGGINNGKIGDKLTLTICRVNSNYPGYAVIRITGLIFISN